MSYRSYYITYRISMGIHILKIRPSRDRLIFNREIPMLVRRYLYFETVPQSQATGSLVAVRMFGMPFGCCVLDC